MTQRQAVSLLLVVLFPIQIGAVEIKKAGWEFPIVQLAVKKAIRPIDTTDRIPGQETLVKTYQMKEGFVFDTFEIDGEVFSCQFHIKGKDGKPPTVYAIVDTDGDGIYESKYGPGEKPGTPAWPIERYLKKHPGLTDPGSSRTAHP